VSVDAVVRRKAAADVAVINSTRSTVTSSGVPLSLEGGGADKKRRSGVVGVPQNKLILIKPSSTKSK